MNQATELAGPAPVRRTDRYDSLDIVRGFALFGILLMNITAFGLPFAYEVPIYAGGNTGADHFYWWFTSVFFEGTQRGLFTLLFGAGVWLLIDRGERAGGGLDVANVYFRRNLWLFLFGMFNAWVLLWTGDILYYYGVVALFLFPLRELRIRHQLALGVGVLLLLSWFNYQHAQSLLEQQTAWQEATTALAAGETLTEEQTEAIDTWEDELVYGEPAPELIEEEIQARKDGYVSTWQIQKGFLTWMQSEGFYRFMFFDSLGMMLIGMALMRLGVVTLQRPTVVYVAMMVVGYGIAIPINIGEAAMIEAAGYSYLSVQQSYLTYDIGRLPMTLGHLGALLLFCRLPILAWFKRAMAAVGRMALTNYLSHSVICLILFNGIGFGLYGELARHQLYYVVFAIWLAQLIISPLWLKHYRFGPMEWVWRSLTYRSRQPMRRASPKAETMPA